MQIAKIEKVNGNFIWMVQKSRLKQLAWPMSPLFSYGGPQLSHQIHKAQRKLQIAHTKFKSLQQIQISHSELQITHSKLQITHSKLQIAHSKFKSPTANSNHSQQIKVAHKIWIWCERFVICCEHLVLMWQLWATVFSKPYAHKEIDRWWMRHTSGKQYACI